MWTPSTSMSYSSFVPSPSSSDDLCNEEPYLVIVEEPATRYRFRYRSEMQGTHGSLLARAEGGFRGKRYPTVQLHNYQGDAFIRCSLYTADPEPVPHIHQLIAIKNNEDVFDHEILVSEGNNYTAEFRGLGIIHVPKNHLKDELVRKRVQTLQEKLKKADTSGCIPDIAIKLEIERRLSKIEADAENDAKSIDRNRATLCFEAFFKDERDRVHYLCKPVFSKPIANMKSVETCELKICRMDRFAGCCRGGEEVFILVEKVCRGNIKVRFYEEDEFGNEVWEDFATFQDYDIHHQYAIVFRTPPYRNPYIEGRVHVKIQLYRPNNNQYSEPLDFVYKPARQYIGKRRCDEATTTNNSSNSIVTKKVFQSDQSGHRTGKSEKKSRLKLYRKKNGGKPGMCITSQEKSSEDLSQMLSDQDPMLIDESTSLGSQSYPSDALRLAVTQFILQESGEPQDLLQQFSAINIEDYFGIGGLKCLGELENQDISNAVTVDGASASGKNFHGIAVTTDGPSQEDLKLLVPKKTQSNEQATTSLVKEACTRLQELVVSDDPSRAQEVKKLLKAKHCDMGPLHAAVIHGQLKELSHILSLLIKGGLCKFINTVNHIRETPLLLAVKKKKADCVKVLLLAGADVNLADFDQNTALHWALKSANSTILEQLLAHNKDDKSSKKMDLNKPNIYGETPLHIALQLDSFEKEKHKLIELLLHSGASPNFIFGGDSPLMIAVFEDDPASVKLLLKAGADPNVVGPREITPLHLAVEFKHYECLRELLAHKSSSTKKAIELNKKNEDGESPLHLAVRMKDIVSVELLIRAGCNVNEKMPTCGNTPLHLAIQNFSPAIIEALLSSESIKIGEENFSCQTPKDMANQGELAELLEKFQITFVEVKEELISDEEYQEYQDISQIDENLELKIDTSQ